MKYLSDYLEPLQTNALQKAGAFFAFGQKQFEEKYLPGTKYANFGAGLFCPVETSDQLMKDFEEAIFQGVKMDVEENGAEAIISREYFNHESQLTGDTSHAKAALSSHIKQYPELFTEEFIEKQFRLSFKKAVENDWF